MYRDLSNKKCVFKKVAEVAERQKSINKITGMGKFHS